jgi:hypothetical protein
VANISDYFHQDKADGRIVTQVKVGDTIWYKDRRWTVSRVYPYWVKLKVVRSKEDDARAMEYAVGSGDLDNFLKETCLSIGDLVMMGLEPQLLNGVMPEPEKKFSRQYHMSTNDGNETYALGEY